MTTAFFTTPAQSIAAKMRWIIQTVGVLWSISWKLSNNWTASKRIAVDIYFDTFRGSRIPVNFAEKIGGIRSEELRAKNWICEGNERRNDGRRSPSIISCRGIYGARLSAFAKVQTREKQPETVFRDTYNAWKVLSVEKEEAFAVFERHPHFPIVSVSPCFFRSLNAIHEGNWKRSARTTLNLLVRAIAPAAFYALPLNFILFLPGVFSFPTDARFTMQIIV